MKYRRCVLLAACFCSGCVFSHDSTDHAPPIAVRMITEYNGVYSNRDGNHLLGLFGHIFSAAKFRVVDSADSVRIVASGKTLKIDAVKDGQVIASNILQQENGFIFS